MPTLVLGTEEDDRTFVDPDHAGGVPEVEGPRPETPLTGARGHQRPDVGALPDVANQFECPVDLLATDARGRCGTHPKGCAPLLQRVTRGVRGEGTQNRQRHRRRKQQDGRNTRKSRRGCVRPHSALRPSVGTIVHIIEDAHLPRSLFR